MPKQRPHGHILTLKNVPPNVYKLIHSLPHGMRASVHKAILNIAANYAKKTGRDWFKDVISDAVDLKRRSK